MSRLRFSLVGCGMRGVRDPSSIAKVIMSMPEAELVAIADADPARAKAAAEYLGLPESAWSDYPSLLARDDVEAVYVVTPNFAHAENAIQALAAGKHILLVKPMALTLSDADRVNEVARKSGCTLMIDTQLPFSPIALAARDLIREGAIGQPVTTWTIHGRGKYRPGDGAWRFTERSGGIFFETLIHNLLFQRWILDRPIARRVWAWGEKTFFKDYAYPDVVWAQVEFEGGLSILLGENHLMDRNFQTAAIVGTEDSLFFEHHRLLLGGKSKNPTPVVEIDPASLTATSFSAASIRHFIDCVQNHRSPEITGEDGRAALELGLAANQAIVTKTPVDLPLMPQPA